MFERHQRSPRCPLQFASSGLVMPANHNLPKSLNFILGRTLTQHPHLHAAVEGVPLLRVVRRQQAAFPFAPRFQTSLQAR